MRTQNLACVGLASAATVWLVLGSSELPAADITFYSFSDSHYGADAGGRRPPKIRCPEVDVINSLPGVAYPSAIGGVVEQPRAVIMQGDLINDGAVAEKYETQWANYIADFGLNGEGRCKFPVFEGIGNHDVNPNLFAFNKVKQRNEIRKNLGYITDISPNGYHYSWDWDEAHFVNVNLFPGNVWQGEADTYGPGHDPLFARDFLVADLKKHVANSGRPVIVVQHFRPIDENWWTHSAADQCQKALQDYNVIAILVGHQGGGVNNLWRGINWISSNGELTVVRIKDETFSAAVRRASDWGQTMRKKVFYSWSQSDLPAVVNNGNWATEISESGATLSGKLVYEANSPTELKVHWGKTDGGDDPDSWESSASLGTVQAGKVASVKVPNLQPWTGYYYRAAAINSRGTVWAAASIPFSTAGTLPDEWKTVQIGYEQRAGGGANFRDGVFTVRGSGRDIAESNQPIDNFQFAHQALRGDGQVIARIASAEINSRQPKIGVMLREKLDAGSKNAALLLVPRFGVRFSARAETNQGSRRKMNEDLKTVPCWVKLVRKGNTFTGYVSKDGDTWEPVGDPVTVAMDEQIFAGLAVTSGSRDESRLHTSDFDNVLISE